MKRVLITGGSGLLALNWACSMRDAFQIYLAMHRHNVELDRVCSVSVDVDSPDLLVKQMEDIGPDLVVHAAGLANVDACEREPAMALHVNAVLSRHVARATARLKIKLIHISTDHLFSGNGMMYREDAPPEPQNSYARTKLLAEQWVSDANPDALLLRTNFFGWGHAGRQSFSDWIISNLRSGRQITVFGDVYFTPILADKLAVIGHALVVQGVAGIFNVVGDERLSKYDFACKIADRFSLPRDLIKYGKITDSNLTAARPKDMSLDNRKARLLLNHRFGAVDDFVKILFQQEQEGRSDELRDAVMEC